MGNDDQNGVVLNKKKEPGSWVRHERGARATPERGVKLKTSAEEGREN